MNKKIICGIICFIVIIIVILTIWILTSKKGKDNSMQSNELIKENVTNTDIAFNFESKKVKLNTGYEMPLNGIGTYSLTGNTCYNAIISALNSGVRLIDTAYMYSNEEEIGKAIKDSKFVVGSTYWNMVYGQMLGDVKNDEEGMANMRNLGENIAYLLKKTK